MDADLIDIAHVLAGHGAGRPRRTFLRRAVSSAYYAVFHRLSRLCADELLGWREPWETYTPVYRALDHKAARDAFNRLGKKGLSPVALIGELFVRLQEERHRADYAPEPFPHDKAATFDLIGQAEHALRLIDSLDPQDRRRLAILLLVKTR